jgi:hypothetical protein
MPNQGGISGKNSRQQCFGYKSYFTGILIGIDVASADVSVKLTLKEAG